MTTARKLVAVMACRAASTRLYAKPLQNLVIGTTILDQQLATLKALDSVVSESCIAIASGKENLAFIDFAEQRGISYIVGSEVDVLSRLISGGLYTGATDVLRLTSENPFIWWEKLPEAWEQHQKQNNHLTVTDGCPHGSYFEIMRMDSLLTAHQKATGYQRDACTQYFRDNSSQFQIAILTPPESLQRLDVRLTVDYPEDLVVCRRIYEHFQKQIPLVPLQGIVNFWDQQPLFKELLSPYITGKGIWVNNEGCQWAPKQ